MPGGNIDIDAEKAETTQSIYQQYLSGMSLNGIIHDFVTLNASVQTQACRRAMDASTAWIRQKNQNLYS